MEGGQNKVEIIDTFTFQTNDTFVHLSFDQT
jgi:hypothetical protein